MMVRNAGVQQSRRMDLRVAIGLGDVIVEPDDIYGHAVNLVARIEGLAGAGDICVSAEIWKLVRGTVAANFEIGLLGDLFLHLRDRFLVFLFLFLVREFDRAALTESRGR